jgi:hypothetical protein
MELLSMINGKVVPTKAVVQKLGEIGSLKYFSVREPKH